MNDKIMVSICCVSYNHGKFIAKAIDGFLKQKTNFPFEILIHDDASTDSTAEIIKSYEKKYPNIHAICQSENQFSKGVSINYKYNFTRARGKYIALCEGDDYWIDECKLQKQFDYMEQNPECGLCFHNAICVDVNNNVVKKSFLPKNDFYKKYFVDENRRYSTEEMILLDFAPTNSLFFKTADAVSLPKFYFDNLSICGDLSYRLFFSSKTYAYYFSDKMSAYRMGVPGSASQCARNSFESKIKTLYGHLKILNEFNIFSNYKYTDSVEEAKKLKMFCHYFSNGCGFVCTRKKFSNFFKRASIQNKIGFYLRNWFPYLYFFLKKK